ncbi:hypothetical protein NQ318_004746 [Aromia moschata]|uniref:Uncharacterized protein n=1 Tax=Aromia moschata TaxID=1265417 RepID=A0AAV8XXV7_9CUCU|nr:hypothetical protein NQ318_004746 [Aromia moschata]
MGGNQSAWTQEEGCVGEGRHKAITA